MKLKFVDKNKSLVAKVRKAIKYLPIENINAFHGDIFKHEGVIVSASNPDFSMGGGLDALIAKHYPEECKKVIKGKNQRIGNVIFTVTVDRRLKSSRELVAEALEFALSNAKRNETILLSGLGTGIGGLDEDDFVWLFLQAVCEANGLGWGIKFTQKDGKSWSVDKRSQKHVKYIVGKWLEIKDAPKDGMDCGHGLHLGSGFIGAGNYNLPEKIFFCIYKKSRVCGIGADKVRVSQLLPLYECPRWLGYGKKGKMILKGLDKKTDPKKYNPYQATKLPTLDRIAKLFKTQVGNQVWGQVGDQVRVQVGNQVGNQVWNQVGNQVGNQVRNQVGNQVGNQVWDQVWNQVGNQVWGQVGDQVRVQVGNQVGNQVRTCSYWSINIHFSLSLTHWIGDFLKLGIMIIFLNGKVKVFGKKGKYLGEYDQKDFIRLQKKYAKD